MVLTAWFGRWRAGLPPFDANGRRVIVGKAARSFGFGLLAYSLGLHFAEIGLSPGQIGIVLGCALLGSMLMTLLIAFLGDRYGRRAFLVAGSVLMCGGLVLPFVSDSVALLALVAATGAIAANPTESSGLVSADQAILPQTVPDERRTDAFAFYSLVAFLASAAGSAALGPLALLAGALGLAPQQQYWPSFVLYAVAGVVSGVSAWRLDARSEVPEVHRVQGFNITRSRRLVTEITALFAWDSFASGIIVPAFMTYWFATAHGMGPAQIGVLAVGTSVLSALSFPVAARLSRRIGLINTMVVTNVPASALLVAIALVPRGPWSIPIVMVFYLLRSFLASMDQPVRQSYLMAVVDPAERTSTAAVTTLVRSGAQTAGPFTATLLAGISIAVPVATSGLLKVVYGLVLWRLFHGRPAPEEVARREAVAAPAGGDAAPG